MKHPILLQVGVVGFVWLSGVVVTVVIYIKISHRLNPFKPRSWVAEIF